MLSDICFGDGIPVKKYELSIPFGFRVIAIFQKFLNFSG